MNKLITEQLDYRKDPVKNAKYEFAILVLKPGYSEQHIQDVAEFVAKNHLKIIHKKIVTFSREDIFVIYFDIFKFSKNDLKFGVDWKKRKLDYMTSEMSVVFILQGKDSQRLSERFKYKLRDKYKKLSIPDKKLSEKEFDELATKNLIHVVDKDATEVVIQLLLNYL